MRSDCLKTLYDVGYLRPELIAGYADDFSRLLHARNNRTVWGSMLALGTIALLRAADLFRHHEEIQAVVAQGSVVTVDNGIKILATIAAAASMAENRVHLGLELCCVRCQAHPGVRGAAAHDRLALLRTINPSSGPQRP